MVLEVYVTNGGSVYFKWIKSGYEGGGEYYQLYNYLNGMD